MILFCKARLELVVISSLLAQLNFVLPLSLGCSIFSAAISSRRPDHPVFIVPAIFAANVGNICKNKNKDKNKISLVTISW